LSLAETTQEKRQTTTHWAIPTVWNARKGSDDRAIRDANVAENPGILVSLRSDISDLPGVKCWR
jgi:hypothetical protein